ncbi:tail fiber assembly protein [Hafnia alvei]|uniref:Caudovirales tail fiber assembly protein n=1 Tax=Hafnia alvei ATCC 51873 TaxID=1002364 RepID=G9Y0G5_HAFAL|nr:tail fiber assembly protein [Hafnia alvei]EHM48844.1 caudovirales tail fiber assembly protein [Hafnia alvei ATCC 51873]QQE44208.1 tail fiber assembly protein [Hafnia alvei]
MTFEMSDQAQIIKVFNLRADTNEFIGAGDAYIPPHTGLPANCTIVPPPAIPFGHVAIFDDKEKTWSLKEDHRDETVYSTMTGQAIYISDIGELPENTVSIAPSGQYEKWDGQAWVKDEEAENNAKQAEAALKQRQLIGDARVTIGEWQTELLLGSITNENKEKLQKWLDYIQALKDVDLNIPEWPEQPQT